MPANASAYSDDAAADREIKRSIQLKKAFTQLRADIADGSANGTVDATTDHGDAPTVPAPAVVAAPAAKAKKIAPKRKAAGSSGPKRTISKSPAKVWR